MGKIKIIISLVFVLFCSNVFAQKDSIPFFKGALKANRDKEFANIQKAIVKKLSVPLSDSTEQIWEDAFYYMELIGYKEDWAFTKIKSAFDSINSRTKDFQTSLLELCYANYPTQFAEEVTTLRNETVNAKVFAMSLEYLYQLDKTNFTSLYLVGMMRVPAIGMIDSSKNSKYIFDALENSSHKVTDKDFSKKVKAIFKKKYLLSNTVLYSIQRKNRNYPGIVIIKDKCGNYVKDETGNIFSVPQLARSITNMPGYISNGNTPQGIFRMYGFDVSRSNVIGPTENIQLTMPFEASIQHFLKDSSITDTIWTKDFYKKLLPTSLQKYSALYESFYAGACGRTEIIAHGTTVNPEFYKDQPYYPLTPTAGCLTTKEIWNSAGKLAETNQQKLVNAIKTAGGADGYCIVIEIDDQQKPVTIEEVLDLLK